jgi:hypothetical protein
MRLGIAEDPMAQPVPAVSKANERENSNAFGQPHRLIAPAPLVSRSSNHAVDPGSIPVTYTATMRLVTGNAFLAGDIDRIDFIRVSCLGAGDSNIAAPFSYFLSSCQLRSFSSAFRPVTARWAVGHPKRVRPLDLHWENLAGVSGRRHPGGFACQNQLPLPNSPHLH